jgi:hypothetical protein
MTLHASSLASSLASTLAAEAQHGSGCLAKTLIRMADGSERAVEDVRPDDHAAVGERESPIRRG